MRVFPVSSESCSAFLFLQSSPSTSINRSLLFSEPSKSIVQSSLFIPTPPSPKLWSFKLSPLLYCTPKSDSPTLGDDQEDEDAVNFVNYASAVDTEVYASDDVVEESEFISEDGVYIEVKKLEKNSRRIESRIPINAPLRTVWNVLTDYERLADFIPGLAVSQLLDKGDKYARLFQVRPYNCRCLPFTIFLRSILF